MTKLNALSGQGLVQPKIGQHGIYAPTMDSLEMVDYINAERQAKAKEEGMPFPCEKYRKLRHADFTKKVPKVLGERVCEKFRTPLRKRAKRRRIPWNINSLNARPA